MRKVYMLIVVLLVIVIAGCKGNSSLFKDPSTVKNKKKEPLYKVNKHAIDMPVFFKLPTDKSNIHLDFEKPGAKLAKVSLQYTIDGWRAFSGKTISSGQDFGLIIDFTTGSVYEMPRDDVRTNISKFTAEDATIIKELIPGKNNRNFTKLVVVDSQGLYNKEELKHLNLLNSLAIATESINSMPKSEIDTQNIPRVEEASTLNQTNKNVVILDRPIITAAANGQYDRLLKMLKNQGNINEIDPATGNNALLLAVQNGDENIANLLMDEGINAKHKNKQKQSALHIASNYGLYNIAEKLLKLGLGVNDKDTGGNTPLMYAAASPNNFLTNLLLENGARIEDKNTEGETPLLIAARVGNTKTVNNLIAKGANPAVVDNEGNSAIMKAVEQNNKYTLKDLINLKLPIDLKNKKGLTPLQVAVAKDNKPLVKELLTNGADINMIDPLGNTPLINATEEGNTPMVQELLKYNPNVLIKNKADKTAFTIAQEKGFAQLQRILGKDMRKFDAASVELFDAVGKNDVDRAVALIKAGANPNAIDKETGNTPIFTAVANNFLYMTKALLENGADANIQNKKGNIPLVISVTSSDIAMVETLINAKSKVNTANNNGDTALIWATKLKNLDMVRALLVGGADPNQKNNEGVSPYLIAYGEDLKEILGLLQAAGGYK